MDLSRTALRIIIYSLLSLQFLFQGLLAQQIIDSVKLEKHLSIIASDDFEGRETGTQGQIKAARYISKIFSFAGLEPPVKTSYGMEYFQDIPMHIGKLEDVSISSNGKKMKWEQDFYGTSVYYPTSKDLSLVFAGYGIDSKEYSDYKDLDVKGKLALILWGEPKDKSGNFLLSDEDKNSIWGTRLGIYKKIKLAREMGAEDVMVIMPNKEEYATRLESLGKYSGSGSYLLPGEEEFEGKKSKYGALYTYPEVFAAFFGLNPKSFIKSVAGFYEKGKKIELNQIKIQIETTHSLSEVITSNILGVLPGTDLKDEYILITSHYDHLGKSGADIYNGADDDGSGTVALLAIAEAFGQQYRSGEKNKRSILFLTFTGEEKGLLGSKYYCDQNPVIPLDQTKCDLNIDMVGRIDEEHEQEQNYVYLIGSDILSTKVHEISEAANESCCQMNFDYRFNDFQDPNNFYKRSDHYNFAKHDIPVIFYFNGSHEDYHRPTDTIDKINFEIYRNRTEVIFHTAKALANYDGIIEADKSFEEPSE